MITVYCRNCDKPLQRNPYEIKKSKTGKFYCNSKCRAKHLNSRITRPCPTCKQLFTVGSIRYKNGKIPYCSDSCSKIAQGYSLAKTINCDCCQKEFKRPPSQISVTNFCSIECRGDWQSKNKSGENNNNWKGGHGGYRGGNWHQQRRAARQRDCETCQGCDISELEAERTLEVHHKKPFRLFDDYKDANHLSNLITLCRTCHSKAESYARWLYDGDRLSPELKGDSVINHIYNSA